MRLFRTRSRHDDGAAMIEFALLLPFLLLILIGIMEYGFALSTNLDIRHGAREAARLAAVDAGSVASMGATACNSMSIADGQVITFSGGGGSIGDEATVTVTLNPYVSLTGFGIPLPGQLDSTVTIRLEQDPDSWGNGSFACP